MLHHRQYTSAFIRSLVSHLNAALTACDVLRKRSAADPHDLPRLELTAVAHILQAREDMKELQSADGAIASQIALFLAVTGCLEDAIHSGGVHACLDSETTRLIGGRIPVETLIALTTAMRDVVELYFAFDEQPNLQRYQRPPVVPEAMIWTTGPDCT